MHTFGSSNFCAGIGAGNFSISNQGGVGHSNTGVGPNALAANTTGLQNTAIGSGAL